MGHGVHVTELYGIGKKYEIGCSGRTRLAVIARKDGTKDLYAFEKDGSEEPASVIHLEEEEAKRLAAVLGDTFFSD